MRLLEATPETLQCHHALAKYDAGHVRADISLGSHDRLMRGRVDVCSGMFRKQKTTPKASTAAARRHGVP